LGTDKCGCFTTDLTSTKSYIDAYYNAWNESFPI
jgi:hypothetical protein